MRERMMLWRRKKVRMRKEAKKRALPKLRA
jgi:hypothetical protein